MCGICGIINLDYKHIAHEPLKQMMSVMVRRGPDDNGSFVDGHVGLGFVRLSILDLSQAGHQPMFSDDNRYVIIFNGEIYNYLEIREELIQKGYSFKSNTDTEVLLKSYIEWGQGCLDKLNGMFAFVIYDVFDKDIFGARDRFGIKPFYWTITDNQFIFASDIPPILKVVKSKPLPNDTTIFDYLVYNRTNHNSHTFFEGIERLPAGYSFYYNNENVSITQWYHLEKEVRKEYSEFNFRDLFFKSIRLQLRSDVPVGCCLSGGLDSTAITAAVLLQNNTIKLHTFSSVYGKGLKGDESEFINSLANERLDMHFTYPNAQGLLNDLDAFIDALSEPVPNTSEYAEFKVMKMAKEYCTVILNGQGADEIMAGYLYFYGYFFRDLLQKWQIATFFKELVQYILLHKSIFGVKAFVFSLYPRLFNNFDHGHLTADFLTIYRKKSNPIETEFYNSGSLQSFMIKHFKYKFEHHLMWADKSGMYFSLETRFPFLDHNLVERTLASKVTIENGYTKALMRNELKGVLPENIRTRVSKEGFSTPEEDWLKSEGMQQLIKKVLNSEKFAHRGYFDAQECIKYYDRFLTGKGNSAKIWKWLNLELWFNKYID